MSEPSEQRPRWLDEGEAIAFTMPAHDSYAHDRIQLGCNAIDMAVTHGWARLRWVDDRDHGLFHLVGKRPEPNTMGKRPAEQKADGSTIFGAATYPVDIIEVNVDMDADGPPRIRSELGGLMGPGYQATGYEPPPRRQVLLDDPTGDDIAGDVP